MVTSRKLSVLLILSSNVNLSLGCTKLKLVRTISCMEAGTAITISSRKEYRNHVKRNTSQHSVITDYRLLDYEFDWKNVEILDEEPILQKRLMSEIPDENKNGINAL